MRYTLRNVSTLLLVAVLGLTLAACGGSSSDGGDSNGVDRELTLQPEGNQIKYATTEMTVQAGETVRLVFENTADSPAMVHNVLFLNTNDDAVVERVGMGAQSAGEEAGYVPEDDAIIAHTPLAQPGETVEVTFTAPEEPGEYTYLCTYPGHWSMMQGTLVVEG